MIRNEITEKWFSDYIDNEMENPNQYTLILSILNPAKGKKQDQRVVGSHYFMPYNLHDINLDKFILNLMSIGDRNLLIYRVLSEELFNEYLGNNLNKKSLVTEEYEFDEYPDETFLLGVNTICITELLDCPVFHRNILKQDSESKSKVSHNFIQV